MDRERSALSRADNQGLAGNYPLQSQITISLMKFVSFRDNSVSCKDNKAGSENCRLRIFTQHL